MIHNRVNILYHLLNSKPHQSIYVFTPYIKSYYAVNYHSTT